MVQPIQEVTFLTATAAQADQLQEAAFDAKKVAQHVVALAYEHTKEMLAAHAGVKSPVAPSDPYSPSGGYVDQLAHLIEDLQNNPNDPKAVLALINFLRNMPDSEANDPTVVNMLKELNIQNSMGTTDNLQNMINEAIELAYVQGGFAAAQAYVDSLNKAPLANSTYAQVIADRANAFDMASFIKEHTDANGNFIWTIPNPSDFTGQSTITYTWDPNNPGSFDNFAIMQIIGNQTVVPYSNYGGSNNGTNPYVQNFDLAGFMQQYRVQGINQIWNQTHNLGLLMMYLMSTYDNDYQSQQGGLANTTNLLSDSTNNVANPLLTLAQTIGNITDPNQAAEFAKLVQGSAAIFGMAPQLSGNNSTVAQDWFTNVVTPISQLSNGMIGKDMRDVLSGQAGASTKLMNDLNALNQQGDNPGPQPGFQAIINAIQSGSGEITGTSKTVSTQLSLVTNQDTQVLKLGSSMATADGGGWVQLINQIINNQVSR